MSVIIAIAGRTASGKTTLTSNLKNKFGGKVSIVCHDNYYKRNDSIPLEERKKINYDAPDAFETSLMTEHLKALKDGKAVYCPVYDYTLHNRTKKTKKIEPFDVIIAEGILVLQSEEIRNLADIKIFVDTDCDERILRRIERDVCERGRDIHGIISQYRKTVKPMHEKYVEPSKKYADIIVSGNSENKNALEVISAWIASKIKSP